MCPTVIYQSDLDCEQRIQRRLKPYPDLGAPACETTTNPTRCITRVFYGATQAPQPACRFR